MMAALELYKTARVDELTELAWKLVPVDIARASRLGEESLALAQALGYDRGAGRALVALASKDFFMAEYDAALSKVHEGLRLLVLTDDVVAQGRMLLMKGLVHWSLGDYDSALEALFASLERADAASEKELTGWALTSLGGVFEALSDLTKAIALHARAYATFTEVGYKVGRARALSGLGAVYYRQGRLGAALEQHLESLRLFREVPSELSEARALNDLGVIHTKRGDFAKALECLNDALHIRERFGNKPAVITTVIHLGELFLDQGDIDEAVRHLRRAVGLASEAAAKPKLTLAHELLSRAYENASDFELALRHQRLSQETKEEVFNAETATRLQNLQIRHEVERAEKEAEIQRLRNVELAGALANLEKTQAQLVQSEKMAALGRLVAGVAHEMNSPLGVAASSIDVVRRWLDRMAPTLDSSAVEVLETSTRMALSGIERLEQTIASLRAFSQVDRSPRRRFDLNDGIDSTLALLEPQWAGRVLVSRRFGRLPLLLGHPHELNQAFMTLLVNAGDSIEGTGTVTIESKATDGEVRIVIRDTGRGIPRDRLPQVFDVGFSHKGSRVRMHTGLASVHATIVELHGGTVEVESEPGEGTVFTITLPLVYPPDV
ncbi:MAG TPA: tetratricopeptide repeat protein [Vicinamibacteria bacterium]|nr:tetratricopeptide repeat protein [Vicinamibacteria bacterium]